MFINSQTGDVISGGASLLETSDYLVHGILLYIFWGAFLIIQVCSARYLKQFWYVNMWVHGLFGCASGITTLAACILLYVKSDEVITCTNTEPVGFFFLIICPWVIFGGIANKLAMEKLKW